MEFTTQKFEPLREMDSFTDDMFNRIIAFQEKEHPAWKEELPFEQRIAGLPLHNLIFSNPDRDPEKFSATVSTYYPLKHEIQKIATYVNRYSAQSSLLDWYPRNGFIGSLIAREGVNVMGLRNSSLRGNQIASFYDPSCYQFTDQPTSADTVFVSWPPSGENPSPQLVDRKFLLIFYVFTTYTDESTGARQTGSDDMLEDLQNDYKLVENWKIVRPENILHEIWPDLTPSIEETRHVHVYALKNSDIQKIAAPGPGKPYDWETDLHMAMLALEAKQQLRGKGIKV